MKAKLCCSEVVKARLKRVQDAREIGIEGHSFKIIQVLNRLFSPLLPVVFCLSVTSSWIVIVNSTLNILTPFINIKTILNDIIISIM